VLLCGICILGSLPDLRTNPVYPWAAVYFMAVWPQIAYFWAIRSVSPLWAEYLNLWVDALHAGFWMVAIQFSLVPCIALGMATSLSHITVGGIRLVWIAWTGNLAGVALGALAWGWQVQSESSLGAQWAAAVLIVGYPLLMGQTLYRLAMHLKRSRRNLRFLSEHDALSGVYNRRYLDGFLKQLFHQVRRHPRPATLVLCDADDFKAVNDTRGHAVGDRVIRETGTALSEAARQGDVVARLGGDEFATVLMDTPADQAQGYLGRAQALLDQKLHDAVPGLQLHLSFGVQALDPELPHHERWLELADSALYAQKSHRKAPPATPPTPADGDGTA
jgi:diguanylate cyclase